MEVMSGEISAISTDQQLALFGPPPLLEGEDPAIYGSLLAGVCAAVEPRDVIEEILVADLMSRQWEIVRLRRQKVALLRVWTNEGLEEFLQEELDLPHFRKELRGAIADILREHLPED